MEPFRSRHDSDLGGVKTSASSVFWPELGDAGARQGYLLLRDKRVTLTQRASEGELPTQCLPRLRVGLV